MSLRDNWKQTGTGLGHAFRDLGKTLVKSAATVARKAENWADSDNNTAADASTEAEVVQEEKPEEKPE